MTRELWCGGCRQKRRLGQFQPSDWQGSPDVPTDECWECTARAREFWARELWAYLAEAA